MRWTRAAAAVLVVACLTGAEPAPDTDETTGPKVQFDVLARATPDGARLGLRYRIAPGWHIYWENPGESGMATSATVASSRGLTPGPLQFPGPAAFGTDVLGYGYSGETMLFIDLTGAPAGSVTVSSRWLVCNDICEPESAEQSIALDDLAAESPDMAAFEAALPRPPAPGDGVSVARSGGQLAIEVQRAQSVTLFPSLALEAAIGGKRPSFLREEIVNKGALHSLRVHDGGALAKGASLGVLRIARSEGAHYVALSAPASESP